MNTMNQKRIAKVVMRILIAPVAGCLLSPVAFAQQADDQTGNDTAKELQEITVTAQKRSERKQDVPMSMQVIDTGNMTSEGNFKLADYMEELPGVSYVKAPMSSNIVMRGIATDSGIGTRPTSAVVIDDVPFGSSINTGTIPDLDPSALQQIEVLRGPQGTLYGASSMGGLIKYVLADPDPAMMFGRVQVGGSGADHGGTGYNARASLNVPVSDNFALRFSGFQRRDPYFVRNESGNDKNDSRVRGGRVSALWSLTDSLTLRASALYQNTRTGASAVVDADSKLRPLYGQYTHDRIAGGDTFDGQVRLYTFKLSWDMGWAVLDSISGYAQHRRAAYQDVGYTAIGVLAPTFADMFGLDSDHPSSVIDNRYGINRTTQELRIASQGDNILDWQAGVFYSDESIDSTQNFFIADKVSGAVYRSFPLLVSEGDTSYREKAVYGDMTYHFTSRFDIQLGVRYARNSLRDNAYSGGILQDTMDSFEGADESATTYLFSPRYRFNDRLMTYVRIASGYRAGGSNGNLVEDTPRSFNSDNLWSYEWGLKAQLLDRRLDLDAALFYVDWSDLQISQVEPSLGSSYTTNAGKAVSQGAELSATWIPSADWRFVFSYAYTDATLAEDIPGYVEGSSAYGKNGDRLPYSARNSLSVSGKRYFPLSGSLDGFVGASMAYRSAREMVFTTSADVPRIRLPGYTTVDLNMGVQGQAWTATFYVRNVGDKVGYLNANRRGSSATSPLGLTLVQPRTIGANLTWDF